MLKKFHGDEWVAMNVDLIGWKHAVTYLHIVGMSLNLALVLCLYCDRDWLLLETLVSEQPHIGKHCLPR